MKPSGYKAARMLNGYKIQTSLYLTIPGPLLTIRRSWRERLLTRPWRPWKATRCEQTTRPDPHVFTMGRDTLLMHPETYESLTPQKEPE